MRDPQVVERDFFAPVEDERLGSYLCPRLPVRVDGKRLRSGPAPALGANRGEPGPPAELPPGGKAGPPLDGVRALSLTTGIAGPNAARHLANFGAEVLKVESRAGGLDAFRFFGSDLDASPRFLETNLGVGSVTLNLKEPAGVALFKELVAESDVVLENFRPDVLPRLGLGYEALRAVRRDVIFARMPGLGRRARAGSTAPGVRRWPRSRDSRFSGTTPASPSRSARRACFPTTSRVCSRP